MYSLGNLPARPPKDHGRVVQGWPNRPHVPFSTHELATQNFRLRCGICQLIFLYWFQTGAKGSLC